MALSFGDGTTDNVDHGNDAALGTMPQFTVMFWFKPAEIGSQFRVIASKTNNAGTAGWQIAKSTGVPLQLFVLRTSGNHEVTLNSSLLDTTNWHFIACTADITNGGPKMYHGTMTKSVADESTFAFDGGGTQISDASDPLWFGNGESGSLSWQSDLACAAVYDTDLSLGEIRKLQFNTAHWNDHSNCLVFTHYGFNGTGTQADWSGNGNRRKCYWISDSIRSCSCRPFIWS